jgi:hypothetical protein
MGERSNPWHSRWRSIFLRNGVCHIERCVRSNLTGCIFSRAGITDINNSLVDVLQHALGDFLAGALHGLGVRALSALRRLQRRGRRWACRSPQPRGGWGWRSCAPRSASWSGRQHVAVGPTGAALRRANGRGPTFSCWAAFLSFCFVLRCPRLACGLRQAAAGSAVRHAACARAGLAALQLARSPAAAPAPAPEKLGARHPLTGAAWAAPPPCPSGPRCPRLRARASQRQRLSRRVRAPDAPATPCTGWGWHASACRALAAHTFRRRCGRGGPHVGVLRRHVLVHGGRGGHPREPSSCLSLAL